MPKFPVSSIEVPTPDIGRLDILLERAAKAESEGRRNDAVQLYQRVLRIDPTQLIAINRLGVASGENGELTAALRQFGDSLRIDPNQSETWFNLGIAQSRLGCFPEALASFDRAIALSPRSGAGHLERAATLARLGRYAEARTAFGDTIRLLPDDPTVAGQHGWTLQWCAAYDEARAEMDRAIALRPDFAQAWVAKAMLLLLLGDLPGGFGLYEWRRHLATSLSEQPAADSELPRKQWRGQTGIQGKTLLIHHEQGVGDTIQFCRYATLAANAGARVIVSAPRELVRLLRTLEGVSQVVSDHELLPDHDLQCPMMSLPLAFRSTLETVPAPRSYLRTEPYLAAEWKSRLSAAMGLRVGLVWAGGSRFGQIELMATDQRRSISLASLAPLASVERCSFVSLQIGPQAAQAKSPPTGMILHDHTSGITDYMDTAALVANLDLVIGVDTSVIHLAGAMGKPVWLLNRFDTCWRWLLDRGDSPWYPTMRIFRQPRPGDWDSVVRSVTESLRALVSS